MPAGADKKKEGEAAVPEAEPEDPEIVAMQAMYLELEAKFIQVRQILAHAPKLYTNRGGRQRQLKRYWRYVAPWTGLGLDSRRPAGGLYHSEAGGA
jgi:hypothetical protein